MTGFPAAMRSGLERYRARRADARSARRNRDRGTECFYCGVAFTDSGALARTVDHRVPRGAGGTDGLANLVFACQACNARKADTDEAAFVASDWLTQRRRAVTDGTVGPVAGGP
jgi:5-methylcytosine-specific restriction endonuclease McrA